MQVLALFGSIIQPSTHVSQVVAAVLHVAHGAVQRSQTLLLPAFTNLPAAHV